MPDVDLDLSYPSPPPPADLAEKAKVRARRRQARTVALIGCCAVVAAGSVAVVVRQRPADSQQSKLSASSPAPTPSLSLPPSDTPLTPVLRPTTAPTAGPQGELPGLGAPVERPASFIAFTPGGAERPTLVSTATGRTIRVLGPGAQVGGVLSPDRTTLFMPESSGGVTGFQCDARWEAITIADGRRTAQPGLDGLSSFEVSPDGQSVAAVVSADGCGNPGNGDAEHLVVLSRDGSTQRSADLPAGNWFVSAWRGDTMLLSDVGGDSTTHSTFDATTLQQVAVLPSPPPGCQAGDANLRNANDVVMGQTCTAGAGKRVDLVDLDPADGAELRRVKVLAAGPDTGPVYNGLGVDASGQNVILQCSCAGSDNGHVYLVLGSRVVDQGMTGVFGALW